MRTASSISIVLSFALLACGGGDGEASESEEGAQSAGGENDQNDANAASVANAEPAQSFHDAIEIMCNGWVGVEELDAPTDEERAPLIMQWIDTQLTNARALQLYDTLMQVAPFQRRQEMSRFATEEGITECAVLAFWPEFQE